MDKKLNIGKVIQLAGAFVACTIGSGFASGQEIMQFFTGYGFMSLFGVVITTIIFSWCGATFMKHGFLYHLNSPSSILEFYFGKKLSKVFEWFFQLFLYCVFIVMIAGAGATLNESFGLPVYVGRLFIALTALVTVSLGLSKLTQVLGKLGPVLILSAVCLGIYCFIRNAQNFETACSLIPALDIKKTGGGWLWSSILHPCFNLIVVLFISCSMGNSSDSVSMARWGGTIGGLLFGLAVCFMNLALIVNIEDIYSKSVPTLFLASGINKYIGLYYSIVIYLGIYSVTVSSLWGITRRYAEDRTKKSFFIALSLTVVGLILSVTDFRTLINIIYPISGYFGLLLLFTVLYKEIKNIGVRHGTQN